MFFFLGTQDTYDLNLVSFNLKPSTLAIELSRYPVIPVPYINQ